MNSHEPDRAQLLERIVAYAHEHGMAGLKLEQIAAWLEMPQEQLREYFASDGDVIAALVARNRTRLRDGYARLDADPSLTHRQLRRRMWEAYLAAADDSELFFEAYGLAMHDPTYGPFLHGVNDWLDLMIETLVRRGFPRGRAGAFATLTLAAYRGAMLDYCVTRDRARVNAAMELWFDLVDRIA